MYAVSRRHEKLERLLQDRNAEPRNVPLEYLRKITNDFSDKQLLGEGGFGKVYKGVFQNGRMIAVKKLKKITLQDRQFENEVYHLMKLKHPNIVLFVGYCYEIQNEVVEINGKYIFAENRQRLLCLEYLPSGSLDRHLSDEPSGLEWDTRYRIIKGLCFGLHYLHEECRSTVNASIIHLDLKPANILLDEDMVPKIADFGLSKLFYDTKTRTCATTLMGSLGYMAPEYLYEHIVTTKADIYSLGVIIIEMITGIKMGPCQSGTSYRDFVETVLGKWTNRLEATSSCTMLENNQRQIQICLKIGIRCLKFDPKERPTTREIVERLIKWKKPSARKHEELPHLQIPTFSHAHATIDCDILKKTNIQVLSSEVSTRNDEHFTRRTFLSIREEFWMGSSAQVSQSDSHVMHFDSEIKIQNPPCQGLHRNEALGRSCCAKGQVAQGSSSLWGLRGSPSLPHGDEDATTLYPQVPTVVETGFPLSEGFDQLPGIKGLCITGEALPGGELQASGYATNGTTFCNFQWVRHLKDGSVNFIKGATQPHYLVTADDVNAVISVAVQPLDDEKRMGNSVKVFANQQRKITHDSEKEELIKRTLITGQVAYEVEVAVLSPVKILNTWERAVLAINMEGYCIKSNRRIVITGKFLEITAINIPYGHRTEFLIIPATGGVAYNIKTAGKTLDRDTIVAVLRLFRKKAVRGKERMISKLFRDDNKEWRTFSLG
ncbi:unnamed protein product [Urochloa humidicola]